MLTVVRRVVHHEYDVRFAVVELFENLLVPSVWLLRFIPPQPRNNPEAVRRIQVRKHSFKRIKFATALRYSHLHDGVTGTGIRH